MEGVNARWPASHPLAAALATVLITEVAWRGLFYAWRGARLRETRGPLVWAGILDQRYGAAGSDWPAVWDLLLRSRSGLG